MNESVAVIVEETTIVLDITGGAVTIFETSPILPSPRSAGDILVAVTAAGFVVARPLISSSTAQILFNANAIMVTA